MSVVLYGVLAVGVVLVLFFLFARFLPAGEQIAPPVRDNPVWLADTDHAVSADDLESLRLPVALRGYRFAETDQLLDRLAAELRQRDAEIARLKHSGG
ncbi:MAG TPA: DivIVA domain-containing protein [Jatrophihabitans sp.]|jgi:hypothetical protein